MINKPFDQIDKADIVNLISNEVREGRMLDYKETLPGNSDSEKTEFLADVYHLLLMQRAVTSSMVFEKDAMKTGSRLEFPKVQMVSKL